MKPYYEGHGATLYLGDCLEILATFTRDSVDLIVTDPPYGIAYQSRLRERAFNKITGDESTEIASQAIPLAMQALKEGRHVYVFGRWTFKKLEGTTEIVWNKQRPGLGDTSGQNPWAPQTEPITFGSYWRSRRSTPHGSVAARRRRGNVLAFNRPSARSHPTEKPVDLLRELIESSSRIGELVLDPFVGIGSTCVAAAVEGRRSIGIEIEERYLEVAAKRLEAVRVEYV